MTDQIDRELRRVTSALATVSPPKPAIPQPRRRGRSFAAPAPLIGVASFAAVLTVGLAVLVFSGGGEQPATLTPAASPPPVTNGSLPARGDSFLPRLVVDIDGFKYVDGSDQTGIGGIRTSEWEAEIGQQMIHIQITGGDDWSPTSLPTEYRITRIPGRGDPSNTTPPSDGYPVETTLPADATDVEPAYQPGSAEISGGEDGLTVRLSITEGQLDPEAIADAIRYVNESQWRAILPDNFVTPEERDEAVAEMLEGVSLPEQLTPADLNQTGLHPDAVISEYHLGADVTGTVACAWITTWVRATSDGDGELAEGAVEAMTGSHQWPVLQEMADHGNGAYPEVLWEYADAMAADGTVTGLPIEGTYREALCGKG